MKVLATEPRPEPYDAENKGVTIIGFEEKLSAGEKANWTVRFAPAK